MDAIIIAAIIAAVTSIVSSILAGLSIYYTKKGNKENIESNKEISNQVQQAEDKRTEVQIDANITWKARVEWIQNVRKETAEFVSAIYKYIHSDPYRESELNRNLEVVQEKKYLLIMYFGPEELDVNKECAENLCDQKTNNAKNKMMVELINSLYSQLCSYFRYEISRQEYHSEGIECIKDLYNKSFNCIHYESEDECIKFQKEQLALENECIKNKQKLFDDIELLVEAMRIYLKLEWKYTKNRSK